MPMFNRLIIGIAAGVVVLEGVPLLAAVHDPTADVIA
jgi:hypothetical protein